LNGYPGCLVIASYPDCITWEDGVDALVAVIKIEPDLIAGGISGEVERSDQAVCIGIIGIMRLIQDGAADTGPGKAAVDKSAGSSVGGAAGEITAVYSNETFYRAGIFGIRCRFDPSVKEEFSVRGSLERFLTTVVKVSLLL